MRRTRKENNAGRRTREGGVWLCSFLEDGSIWAETEGRGSERCACFGTMWFLPRQEPLHRSRGGTLFCVLKSRKEPTREGEEQEVQVHWSGRPEDAAIVWTFGFTVSEGGATGRFRATSEGLSLKSITLWRGFGWNVCWLLLLLLLLCCVTLAWRKQVSLLPSEQVSDVQTYKCDEIPPRYGYMVETSIWGLSYCLAKLTFLQSLL